MKVKVVTAEDPEQFSVAVNAAIEAIQREFGVTTITLQYAPVYRQENKRTLFTVLITFN